MKLTTVLTSVNNNSNYYSFIPKQIIFWNHFNIRFIAIFVSEKIPDELLPYSDNIFIWNKNMDLHSVFVAQNIRIYYPALLDLPNDEMVMITDMDMLPMNDHYYTSGLDNYTTEDFIYYRNIDGNQIYMCYNAAHPSTWAKVFEVESEGDIERKLYENYHKSYDGIPGSHGWYSDQIIMYNQLHQYPHLQVLNRPIKRIDVNMDNINGIPYVNMYLQHLNRNETDFIHNYDDAHFHRSYFEYESIILDAEKQLKKKFIENDRLLKNRGFILFFTQDWMDIIMNLINSILMFSKYDIETYCIGFEYNFNHPRIRNNTIQLNHLHFFNITKCKLIASVNTLFDYALLLDGDMIVNKDIDQIFEDNEIRIQQYKCPLFAKHPHNPFERYSEIISSITKKTPKMKWVYSNYLFIRSQIWFLEEVLTFMDNITDYSFYYPVPEEGIINALLTEYEVDYDLGYNYFPPGLLSVVDYYMDGKNVEGKKHIDAYLLYDCPIKMYAFHGHDIKNVEIGKQILQRLSDVKKKVITFSLWGDKPIYNVGAIINAKDSIQFYPDFECWFYVHMETVPKETVDTLSQISHVKIICKTGDLLVNKSMMWRFEAIDDPTVAIMMPRDTDSRFTQREKLAVEEWLNSDCVFHIMRDHPHHKFSILGGMFGTRKIPGIPSWTTLIQHFLQYGTYEYDQDFLENNIYDMVKENAMIHATFNRVESNCRFFPIDYDLNYSFVGECINYDNSRNTNDINILIHEYQI